MQSFGMKGVYATGNYRRLALSLLPLNFPARLSRVSGAEPMKRMFSSKRLQDAQQFAWKIKAFRVATNWQVSHGTPSPFKKDVRPSCSPPSCALVLSPNRLGMPDMGVPWSPAPLGLPGSSWPHHPDVQGHHTEWCLTVT